MRAAVPLVCLALCACKDLSGFSSKADDHFEGAVVSGSFVRAGIADGTRMCLTLDMNHLQDAPGALWSSDGQLHATPLRPIPQIWHDPLSTMTFGEGRLKNMMYAVTPQADGGAEDMLVVVSLLQSNDVEVRIVRGAPPVGAQAGDAGASGAIFGVFTLTRQPGACPF